jgi:hypothetical protein
MRFHALGSFADFEHSERRLPPFRSVLALGIMSHGQSQTSNPVVHASKTRVLRSSAFVAACVFTYLVSIGPVAQLVMAGYIPQQCEWAYRPLEVAADWIPGGTGMLIDYIAWWNFMWSHPV